MHPMLRQLTAVGAFRLQPADLVQCNGIRAVKAQEQLPRLREVPGNAVARQYGTRHVQCAEAFTDTGC